MYDEIDRLIISELQQNGRKSLLEISKKAGISQVAIKKRLTKLQKNELISISVNLNLEPFGARIGLIIAEVENNKRMKEILKKYNSCPRIIYLSIISGSQLMCIMIGETLRILECTLKTCSLRIEKGIRQSQVSIGEYPIYPKYLPINIGHSCSIEISPCGVKCNICESFIDKKCIGCPSTKFYNILDEDKEI